MRRLANPVPLGEIAGFLGIALDEAAAQRPISGLAPLESARAGDISFLNDRRYGRLAAESAAAAVLVRDAERDLLAPSAAALPVADPYLELARLSNWFAERLGRRPAPAGIHPLAHIGEGALLGRHVRIDAHASVGAGARIGDGATIGPGVVVGDDAEIGAHTRLYPGVVVYADCRIGARCLIHAGTVIGSDGFGFARDGARWHKIAQLGSVRIGDEVEIGANCTIDRGALDDTLIADGCKLDNLIQVAHNVRIGEHTAIAGCVGIAGSARIGRRCMIGGGAGILGHLEICDDVIVSAMSLVTRSIRERGFYSGVFPLMDNAGWEKAAAALRHLPDLRARLRRLESLTKEGS